MTKQAGQVAHKTVTSTKEKWEQINPEEQVDKAADSAEKTVRVSIVPHRFQDADQDSGCWSRYLMKFLFLELLPLRTRSPESKILVHNNFAWPRISWVHIDMILRLLRIWVPQMLQLALIRIVAICMTIFKGLKFACLLHKLQGKLQALENSRANSNYSEDSISGTPFVQRLVSHLHNNTIYKLYVVWQCEIWFHQHRPIYIRIPLIYRPTYRVLTVYVSNCKGNKPACRDVWCQATT